MLSKLIKYEFKATGRIFLPIFGALLIVSIINRIFMSLSFRVPSTIGITISVIMMIAICVLTLILTLQRFNRNLLGSEGYLMFTLPVRTGNLIFSKLIVSSVWFIVSWIIVIIAILIMYLTEVNIIDLIRENLHMILSSLRIETIQVFSYFLEFAALSLLSLFSGIMMLYACLAVSLFFNKHRGLYAFGVFIIFNIIGQTLAAVLLSSGTVEFMIDSIFYLSHAIQIHIVLGFGIFVSIILCLVFYLLIMYMLKNKLNLE